MKTLILTQKNVCAFLGLIMALTIVFSAKANATPSEFNPSTVMELKKGTEAVKDEMVPPMEIDLTDVKAVPSITFINKYGEVVAEFYGEKNLISKRFEELFEKGQFITSSGNQEFYLVK
jgi:hypothetical protein